MKWKYILNSRYEISIEGEIRNSNSGRILKTYTTNDGYGKRLKIKLPIQGTRKTYQVHRLIAEAFIPNPENKMEVDHINGDTLDNSISNLRWATRKENVNNRYMSISRINKVIELYNKGFTPTEIRGYFI